MKTVDQRSRRTKESPKLMETVHKKARRKSLALFFLYWFVIILRNCRLITYPELSQAPDEDAPVDLHFIALVQRDGQLFELGKFV